jgi:hypothetical protein
MLTAKIGPIARRTCVSLMPEVRWQSRSSLAADDLICLHTADVTARAERSIQRGPLAKIEANALGGLKISPKLEVSRLFEW